MKHVLLGILWVKKDENKFGAEGCGQLLLADWTNL
jgi:hypothetical protein